MDATVCATTLTDLFDREQAVLGKLIETLEREFQALQASDTDALEQASAVKVTQLKQIEEMEQVLADVVTRAGFRHDRDGIEACIDWCNAGQPGGLEVKWDRLLQSLQACQERNRHNGAAIETHRLHAQSALAVLRGQTARPATYAASGTADPKEMNTRSLAKA